MAPADSEVVSGKLQAGPNLIARYRADFQISSPEDIHYMDVSPSQMVGVSAGLIPFLEHDDANRALMGSNMQRQAVPLLVTEPPIVATGMELDVARNSSMVVTAKRAGKVTYCDAQRVEVGSDVYDLKKYVGLNERTCNNQKPIVQIGDKVEKGQVLADGAATYQGELALGRNVLVGFMSFDGYNFEDAIIISQELVQNDTYTSIHIEEFDVEIRETKLGREEFTRDIPNVSDKALRNLDESGIVQVGTYVRQGDILVGKVSPKSKTELTPEEKLLHAIFGRAGEDVKNDSLEVPSGIEGIVIDTQKFSRKLSLSDGERKAFEKDLADADAEGAKRVAGAFREMVTAMEAASGRALSDEDGTPLIQDQEDAAVAERAKLFQTKQITSRMRSEDKIADIEQLYKKHWPAVETAIDAHERKLNSMKRGDELRSGVLQMVKVYIATKRVISVGDKMAGRHGNKGVIAKILARRGHAVSAGRNSDPDHAQPVGCSQPYERGPDSGDPPGVGWRDARLPGRHTGVRRRRRAGDQRLPGDGGICPATARSGSRTAARARRWSRRRRSATSICSSCITWSTTRCTLAARVPYSLITQQPLGGKARFGGQRFGEMEVWALEAYGAAYILQELLTVKSDDVEGRTKIYESMVKGENTLEAGTPASFDVLTNEIRGLALNMQLEKRRF